MTTVLHGVCDPDFVAVRDAFAANFTDRHEVGAAVCVYHKGHKVVDLWGGLSDPTTDTPWQRDTIVCMMSVGKSMAALALLRLVDRGAADLDAPVATYWPEFAQAGKDRITVRQLMAGQAGLMYADHAPEGAVLHWDVLADALAKQAPEWPAGTKGAYHSTTQGILLGELARRVDGRDFKTLFEEEVTTPLGADYHFGLSDEEIARTADLIPNPGSTTLQQISDPSTKLGRAWRVRPKIPGFMNSTEYRKVVFPSGNGHGNARAIARIYAALANGGRLDGFHLLSQHLIDELRKPAWDGVCDLTERHFRYGLGFFLSAYPDPTHGLHFSPNRRAFGHPGAGGAMGFCDPEANLSFSYSPNYMCAGAGVGDRCEALVDATLSSAGLT